MISTATAWAGPGNSATRSCNRSSDRADTTRSAPAALIFNARARPSQLSAGDLAKELDYIGLRKDPAVAYLNIAIRHTVHHRGQLSAYLRGMGAGVPAIYVESADEPYPSIDGSVVVPPSF